MDKISILKFYRNQKIGRNKLIPN